MFPTSMFPASYFAPAYFPPGAVVIVIAAAEKLIGYVMNVGQLMNR